MERPATEADKKYEKWLKEKSNGILVAASLTATMAYTTALTPPGGVWQENYNEIPPGTTYFSRRVGLSVLAESNPHGLTGFSALLGFNTVGFICSITVSTFASVYNYGLRVAKETVPHQTSR
ncbi:uncharacterized protein LOC113350394 [Papaver somniferum]|uniref:uncharacterized protein LOC113350394 n=1 Tax=Papaver somniferum TaxID=3469 RepID=UPI000E6FF03E|nr:uncharacterized protein LOC113350394 [Papaver somniferum]